MGDRCPKNQILFEKWMETNINNGGDFQATKKLAESDLYRAGNNENERDCVKRAWRYTTRRLKDVTDSTDTELKDWFNIVSTQKVRKTEKNFDVRSMSHDDLTKRRIINAVLSIDTKRIHHLLLYSELRSMLNPLCFLTGKCLEDRETSGLDILHSSAMRHLKTIFYPENNNKRFLKFIPDTFLDKKYIASEILNYITSIESALKQKVGRNALYFGEYSDSESFSSSYDSSDSL